MSGSKKYNSNKVIYYSTYTDDVVESSNQNYRLKSGYRWINNNVFHKAGSHIIYGIAVIAGLTGCKLVWGISYKNKKVLRECIDKGYFIYANHTQPVGDVVIPAISCIRKRVYVIVSQANYGIPVIGKLLPMLGALPIPNSISEYKKFTKAYKKRISDGHPVVIYPEAHVWPYYNKIRPFEKTSFRFPAELGAPVYVMTTTYTRRRLFGRAMKKPKINVYVDGPYYIDENLSIKDNQQQLHDKVYEVMNMRSKQSDYEYIQYIHCSHNSAVDKDISH